LDGFTGGGGTGSDVAAMEAVLTGLAGGGGM
jgi:hypothetical protein